MLFIVFILTMTIRTLLPESLLTNHPIPPPIHMYMYVHNQSRVNATIIRGWVSVCASNLAPYLLRPFTSHILDLGSYLYMYIEISHLIYTQLTSIFLFIQYVTCNDWRPRLWRTNQALMEGVTKVVEYRGKETPIYYAHTTKHPCTPWPPFARCDPPIDL